MLWRFRGTPHYLGQQASRLGVTPVLADRARNNQEIYRVSVLLAQLCERYHKARKEDGRPVLPAPSWPRSAGRCSRPSRNAPSCTRLAATAADMIDEAYRGFRAPNSTGPAFRRAVAISTHRPIPPAARRRDRRHLRRPIRAALTRLTMSYTAPTVTASGTTSPSSRPAAPAAHLEALIAAQAATAGADRRPRRCAATGSGGTLPAADLLRRRHRDRTASAKRRASPVSPARRSRPASTSSSRSRRFKSGNVSRNTVYRARRSTGPFTLAASGITTSTLRSPRRCRRIATPSTRRRSTRPA